MKNKVFKRTIKISLIVFFCFFMGIFGIIKAYEGIRKVGYGEYENGVYANQKEIKILDFKFGINNLF